MNPQRRVSVTFDENVITSDDINLNIKSDSNSLQEETSEKYTHDKEVQTASEWLELLKTELLGSIVVEQKEKVNQPSKAGTIKSHTTATKRSTTKSKKSTNKALEEKSEKPSISSDAASESMPAYPEMMVNDEYGVAFLNSSDDDDDDDNEINIKQLTELSQQPSIKNPLNTEIKLQRAQARCVLPDTGVPAALRPSKEISSVPGTAPEDKLRQTLMSPESILRRAMSARKNESDEIRCEFCAKSLKKLPNIANQITDNLDQSESFCCQEYRELVDFALKQDKIQETMSRKSNKNLIDVEPGKSFKSDVEVAEDKAKSEKKIREKILARQQAALLAAQMAQKRVEAARRAHTEIQHFEEENSTTRTLEIIPAKQMKVVNYQLSNDKYLKDGWTITPEFISNEELIADDDLKQEVIGVDFTMPSLDEIFNHSYMSCECLRNGFIRENYKGSDNLFMILLKDGSGNIYYPSGNLGIIFIRDSTDGSVICIIREDKPLSDAKCNLLGYISTKGQGHFSYPNKKLRLIFDSVMGLEFHKDNSKKRNWFWDGEPHMHAPPFQPIFFSLNHNIGIRISSQNQVFVNFLGTNRHIHINIGCKRELAKSTQQKIMAVSRVQNDKLMDPLISLRQRIRDIIKKSHEALAHPTLTIDNKWPLKPIRSGKTNGDSYLVSVKPQ